MDKQTLRDYVNSARDELEDARGFEEIDGACHENVIFLAEYLDMHVDIPLYLRWGAVDVHRDIQTVKDSEDCDPPRTHFWLETHLDGEWLYLDVFTMRSAPDGISRGQVICVNKLPVDYQVPEESLFKYRETMKARDLITYQDYEYFCRKYGTTSKETALSKS
jgi:hypothetical protein